MLLPVYVFQTLSPPSLSSRIAYWLLAIRVSDTLYFPYSYVFAPMDSPGILENKVVSLGKSNQVGHVTFPGNVTAADL